MFKKPYMGVNPKIGVKPPKWIVKIRENPIRIDDLGVPQFLETHTYYCTAFLGSLSYGNLEMAKNWPRFGFLFTTHLTSGFLFTAKFKLPELEITTSSTLPSCLQCLRTRDDRLLRRFTGVPVYRKNRLPGRRFRFQIRKKKREVAALQKLRHTTHPGWCCWGNAGSKFGKYIRLVPFCIATKSYLLKISHFNFRP